MALTNNGTPTSANYEIGRGKLLLDIYTTQGAATGSYLDIGNASALTLSVEEESLEHTSSLEGLATKDKTVTLSKSLKGSFTLEEITKENLELFFSGDLSTYVQTTRVNAEFDITVTSGNKYKWLKLFDQTTPGGTNWFTKNAYPVFDITAYEVTADGAGGTVYTEGTDYEIDTKYGLFRPVGLSNATYDLKMSFTGKSYDQVRMLNRTTVNARLMFLGEDAYTGKKKLLRLHKIKLMGSGDSAQIGDEWSQLNFEFTVEKDTSYDSASPYGEIVPV